MLGAAAAAAGLASPAHELTPHPLVWLAGYPLLVFTLLSARGAYAPRLRLQLLDDLRLVVVATALAAMAVITLRALLTDDPQAAGDTVRQLVFTTVYLACGKAGVFVMEGRARRRGQAGRPTLIVGAGKVGRLVARRLLDEPELGLAPIGFLDKEPLSPVDGRRSADLPVLGASWDLDRVIAEHEVQHVILAFSTAPHHVLLRVVDSCEELGVSVSQMPRLFENMTDRTYVERLGALPLISRRPADLSGWQFGVKTALDRLLAALLLLVALPLLAVAALAIALSMGGPIFFFQRRVGLDGQEFDILKFRTMRPVDPEDVTVPGAAGTDDRVPGGVEGADRRTGTGALLRRTSIDELPQLLNVLRGEMSLVGPRPERLEFVERFRDDVYRYKRRHRVKSGITGWAQVNEIAHGGASVSKRVEWDNYYIENWSLWLDVKVLLYTPLAVLRRRPLTSYAP